MKEIFSKVQKKFMELSLYLSSLDLEKDLHKQSVLEEVNRALSETFFLFEQGLCEAVPMCNKCDMNRVHLSKLVILVNDCTQNEKITPEASAALNDFLKIIPQVFSEMKTLYLASLSKTS